MTIESPQRWARARTGALSTVIVLLTGAIQLAAQSRMATASLSVQVRPEGLLQAQSGSVALKIRLSRGTTARLWRGNDCASPSPQAYLISMSGTYNIPFGALKSAVVDAGQRTKRVCLASSDGLLNDSLPVEISEAGTSSAGQGPVSLTAPSPVSLAVPVGVVVTTQGATTTWSTP
jgi:hypothetical protein